MRKSDTIAVYEVGSGLGDIDDRYDLYLTRSFDCGGTGPPTADCAFLVGDGKVEGLFTMPSSAF